MTRIAVVGAAGRMGRTLIQAVTLHDSLTLGAATERAGSSLVGADAGELAGVGRLGIAVSDDLEKVADDFDVVIDFSAPAATLHHLKVCDQHGKKLVIGTTGFDEAGKARIAEVGARHGIVFAPNMSVGVNLCLKLLALTAEKDPVKVERDLMELVPRSHWTLWSHLLIDHGRAVCKARRPDCGSCALLDLCPSAEI